MATPEYRKEEKIVEIYTLLLKFSHAFLRVATRIITSIARAATHPAAPVSPLERTKILYCPSVRLLHDKKISSASMALSKTNSPTIACQGQCSKYFCILPDTLSKVFSRCHKIYTLRKIYPGYPGVPIFM